MFNRIKTILKSFYRRYSQLTRIIKYGLLSTNTHSGCKPVREQPVFLAGQGRIEFEDQVKIGVPTSPNFWTSVCYLEARSKESKILIGEQTWINNGFSAISDKSAICIGRNCYIGPDVLIFDSDFHTIDPDARLDKSGTHGCQPVSIGNNVFIGARVIILKNSKIGDGSVIAAGSIVSGQFPERSLIAGRSSTLIRSL